MSRIDLPRVTNADALKERLVKCAEEGVEAINARLAQLDREWTAGRMVKATTGVISVIGLMFAALVNPLWLLLPAAAGVFLLQYLFFRQSVLTETFHAMGFRSGHTVDEERLLLRALRGDFVGLPTMDTVQDVKEEVERMEDEGGPALPEPDEPRYAPREAATLLVGVVQ